MVRATAADPRAWNLLEALRPAGSGLSAVPVVAVVDKGALEDGLRDLRFDEAAHLEDAVRYLAQLGIELGGEVLVAHVRVPGNDVVLYTVSGYETRAQPKRPVM